MVLKRSPHLKREDANADGKVSSIGALTISIVARNAGELEEHGSAP